MNSKRYSGFYLKRCSHTNFNSYVANTMSESFFNRNSFCARVFFGYRARNMGKSRNKERDDGQYCNGYYKLISSTLAHVKHPTGSKYPIGLIRPITCARHNHVI